MDFYIIIVPALVLSLCMILNLLILKRRDKYLFAGLQHSQDIMSIIRERGFNLSKEEYQRLRNLIEATGEATVLASLYPTSITLNPKASEADLITNLNSLNSANVLHFATHGAFKEPSEEDKALEKIAIEEKREGLSQS